MIHMAGSTHSDTAPREDIVEFEDEFTLDVRVIEDSQPDGRMLLSTSDNCGSTCSGTACTSSAGYPA
jgi:FxLD family lantipeptide